MGKVRHDMSGGELAAFCEQLLFIVKGGVPLQEGLMILQEDAEPGGDAQLLSQLLEPMEMGSSLADAMARTGRFPSYMIQMVRALGKPRASSRRCSRACAPIISATRPSPRASAAPSPIPWS